MKIKAALEGMVAGLISASLSYAALISRATVAAIELRRKMPDAWFSGLIVWYATFIVILVSIVIAAVVYQLVYKHQTDAAQTSGLSE
jgi:cell division protein FtsX